MGWQDVAPSDEVEAAEWIRGRLQRFGSGTVGSVVPTGFTAYARGPLREWPMTAVGPEVASILARHTSTPTRCWFCLWDGYGYLTGAAWETRSYRLEPGMPPPKGPFTRRLPAPKLQPSRVRLPARDYLLFTGTVDQGAGWSDGPNLWWPDDRAWCVA